jgi:HEAT repeat protein
MSEWLAEGNNEHSTEAIYALQQIGTNALPHLLKWIQLEMPAWRRQALSIAKKLPSGYLRDKAVRIVIDRSLQNKTAFALFGFRILGTNAVSVVPQLTDLLQHHSKVVRIRAMAALEPIGPEGLRPIFAAAMDEHYSSRADAIRVVACCDVSKNSTDEQRITEFLVQCVNDRDSNVVLVAVSCMPRRDYGKTVPALLSALSHRDPSVRRMVLVSFERFGVIAHPGIVPGLVAALKDNDRVVRMMATNVMGAIAPGELEKLNRQH